MSLLRCLVPASLLCAFTQGIAAAAPPSRTPLRFARACEPATQSVTLAAVGDLLLHTPLQRAAQANRERGGFATLWANVQGWLNLGHLRYANFEGPAARSFAPSSYPAFNYAPSLVDDLVRSGFSVVSTANNHALDKGSRGADETLDALEAGGLPYTGTRRSGERNVPWHAVTRSGGFQLAWLACTYSTNGIVDRHQQVLHCYEDQEEVLAQIRTLSHTPGIDAVIVTPHWGVEYKHTPEARERALGRKMLEAGALAVIGAHPHVLQSWEKLTINGSERFILYSLGNFVSGQQGDARRASTLLYLGLSKDRAGTVWINGVRNLPLTMVLRGGEVGVVPSHTLSAKEGGPSLAINRTLFTSDREVSGLPEDGLKTNLECGN
jgi:hypothetical protein